MIISKEVEVDIKLIRVKNFYKNLGYDINDDKIIVSITDVPKNSNINLVLIKICTIFV